MKKLYEIPFLRKLVLPLLQRVMSRDIRIRHHWTGDKITLNAFKHKGYWYHGKKRELKSMALFSQLASPGDFVMEVGGHIGYISVHYAHLIGATGRLIVFEPAPCNLPYLRKNTMANPCIRIVEKAVSDFTGSAKLHVESLTGQNNSLLPNYRTFQENAKRAFVDTDQDVVEVPCITLDDFLAEEQLQPPSFIKIDVEGAELQVLKGMKIILKKNDVALMVEVTENAKEVIRLLKDAGYLIFRPDLRPVEEVKGMVGNVFCLKHSDVRVKFFYS